MRTSPLISNPESQEVGTAGDFETVETIPPNITRL
jgi:hypothetical protein